MNNTIQTLLRSLLKIGAGYLISKGFIDDSHAEEGIAAALGLAAIIWGVFHRTPQGSCPGTAPPQKPCRYGSEQLATDCHSIRHSYGLCAISAD
jgi:hypothetical protein